MIRINVISIKYTAIVVSDCMNADFDKVPAVNSVPLSIINLNNNYRRNMIANDVL